MPLAKCAARSSRNEAENHGHVAKFVAGEGYGFIETADGRKVYFHRNSVLDDAFEHLTVGSEVRFVEEMGEKGPQATSVLRWDRASTASQQDFEINPRAHKLRITRKQRLAGLQLARLSNGGDYCTESSPVSDRRVQVGVGKLPREIMQSRIVTDQKHRVRALRKVPELLP